MRFTQPVPGVTRSWLRSGRGYSFGLQSVYLRTAPGRRPSGGRAHYSRRWVHLGWRYCYGFRFGVYYAGCRYCSPSKPRYLSSFLGSSLSPRRPS